MNLSVIELLEQEIYDQNIVIENKKLSIIKAVGISNNNKKSIFVDKNLIKDTKELRIILEHEKEHFSNSKTLYNFETSITARKRREAKIDRILFNKLLPIDTLVNYLKKDISIYEISEELCLSEDFIINAFQYYKKYGKI